MFRRSIFALLLAGAPSLYAQTHGDVTGSPVPELIVTTVDPGTTRIEETTVHLSGIANRGGSRVNGMKAYSFALKPKETLSFQLIAEGSELIMTFLEPNVPNAMTSAVRRSNIPPKSYRAHKIQIQNPTSSPQEAALLVAGRVNIPFVLVINHE